MVRIWAAGMPRDTEGLGTSADAVEESAMGAISLEAVISGNAESLPRIGSLPEVEAGELPGAGVGSMAVASEV